MKAAEALIAWTPDREPYLDEPMRGQMKVGHLLGPDDFDWSAPFAMTGGAAYKVRAKMDGWEQVACVFIDFQALVVDAGIDPQIVHAEFMKIDEYNSTLANPPALKAFTGGH